MVVIGNILLTITMLCLISVVGLQWAVGGWMPSLTIMLVIAAVSFVASIVINAKFYWAIIKSDGFGFIAKSAGLTALVFVFLTAINYLGFSYNKVFDFTENKINSLTEFSQGALEGLEKDFVFYFFVTSSEQSKSEEVFVRKTIEIYQRYSPKVKLKVVSMYEDPELVKEFKLGDEPSALFATYEGRRKRLQIVTETEVTGAILQLSRPQKIAYFTQGHGERKLTEEESYGLFRLKSELERLYFAVKPLNQFPVPKDAAFLAIVGPRMEFDDSELAEINKYITGGGSLLLALDPGESHNLPLLTKEYGVEFQNTFVSSEDSESSPFAVFVNSTDYEHDLLKTLQGEQRPLLYIASPLKVSFNVGKDHKVMPLLRFEPNTVSRTELDRKSGQSGEGGQVAATITEANESTKDFYRVLVVGDSDFMTNQFISQHANFNFLFNAVNYLSREKDIINLKPKVARTTYLLMTQTQLNFYVLFFILPMPFLFFIVALFLKLRRSF